jgi:hypothetical protein
MGYLKYFIPHHPIPVVMYFIYAKNITYAWSFVDVFTISITRALAFRYQALNEQITAQYGSNRDDDEKSSKNDKH